MRKKELALFVVSAAAIGLLLTFCTGSARAEDKQPEASVPRYVATIDGTGGFPTIMVGAGGDSTGLHLMQITAATELDFTIWKYHRKWELLAPTFGYAAADTVITIPAGSTEVYTSEGRDFWLVYVSAGTGLIKGE